MAEVASSSFGSEVIVHKGSAVFYGKAFHWHESVSLFPRALRMKMIPSKEEKKCFPFFLFRLHWKKKKSRIRAFVYLVVNNLPSSFVNCATRVLWPREEHRPWKILDSMNEWRKELLYNYLFLMRLLKESRLMLMNLLSSFPFRLLPVWNPGEYRRFYSNSRTKENLAKYHDRTPRKKKKKTAEASTPGNVILITRVTCLHQRGGEGDYIG